jgi:hypothetical protein
MRAGFTNTVSAFCYSILADEVEKVSPADSAAVSANAVVNFVLEQHRRMPDYMRFPVIVLTLVFDLAGLFHGGRLFHRMAPSARRQQIAAWRESRSPVARDFVRLFDSLAVFCWVSNLVAHQQAVASAPVVVRLPVLVANDLVLDTPAASVDPAAIAERYQPAWHQV